MIQVAACAIVAPRVSHCGQPLIGAGFDAVAAGLSGGVFFPELCCCTGFPEMIQSTGLK